MKLNTDESEYITRSELADVLESMADQFASWSVSTSTVPKFMRAVISRLRHPSADSVPLSSVTHKAHKVWKWDIEYKFERSSDRGPVEVRIRADKSKVVTSERMKSTGLGWYPADYQAGAEWYAREVLKLAEHNRDKLGESYRSTPLFEEYTFSRFTGNGLEVVEVRVRASSSGIIAKHRLKGYQEWNQLHLQSADARPFIREIVRLASLESEEKGSDCVKSRADIHMEIGRLSNVMLQFSYHPCKGEAYNTSVLALRKAARAQIDALLWVLGELRGSSIVDVETSNVQTLAADRDGYLSSTEDS